MNQQNALLVALNALQAIDDKHPYPIAKHAIVQISKALAQTEPQVCCGDYEKCMNACTPRGRWLAEKELAKPEQEPEPWDASDMAHRAGGLSVEQEPVGWFDWDAKQELWVQVYPNTHGQPLYTAPPSKEWVSLTDDEIHEAAIKCVKSGQSINAAIRTI